MKQRGRPVLGAIAGFFFGIFLSFDLVMFDVMALDSNVLAALPVAGVAAGVVMGRKAPLRRRGRKQVLVAKPGTGAA